MDRTERLLLVVITILHVLALVYLSFSPPAYLNPSPHEIRRIADSLGVDPVAYQESFQYTIELYPFLPPDTVWLKKSH